MNPLIQALLWCGLQVTVLAVAALVVGSAVTRRRPAAGALVAAAALVLVVGLTATALSPWPNWTIAWERLPWRTTVAVATPTAPEPVPQFDSRDFNDATVTLADNREFRTTIGRAPEQREPDKSLLDRARVHVPANWMTLAAAVYLTGVGVMALRIALGLYAVRTYRRDSHPITNCRLAELADVVCAQLGCTVNVELRETTRLATPATIGWHRPMLLLPANWRSWNDDERRAVLAHEIEHIRRNDFAAWIASQLGVALHFYHPLVHWLASRLRLQQELAADAAAARVLGGQRKYVTTLAAMALRQSDAPVAWPAQAFLPNSKTFLRRIEMLHRSKPLRGDVPRSVLIVSLTAVVLAAVCAAGIRGTSAGDQGASSGNTAANGDATESVALAENVALQDQAAEPPAQQAPAANSLKQRAEFQRTVNHLKQLGLAMYNYHDKHNHFPPAVVMGPDGKTPHSWRVELLPYLDQQALYDQYRMNEPWDSESNKKVLERMPEVLRSPFDDSKSTNSGYYVLVGPGTIFEGSEGIKVRDITDGTSLTLLVVEAKRNIPWTKPDDIAFDADKPLPELGGFVKNRFVGAMADGSVRVYETDKVRDQLKWLIMRNDHHPILIEKLGPNPRTGARVMPPRSVGAADRPRLRFTAAPDRLNQLKQLVLAMHNYHDVHGHFPPAVVMGPDGKTPHSWRVELLPFLKENPLYKQYDQNQPWDSDTNKKVLEKMPAVFHSSLDTAKSTNSAYYVLVGPGTIFEGSDGIKIQEITDGTSNTLLAVEAKRNIPWTKPEDIAFEPDKPLPELGGFVKGRFAAAMGDGSVRVYETDKVQDQLKWLIMRNDSHPIDLEKLGHDPRRVERFMPAPRGGAAERPQLKFALPSDRANQLKQLALAMHNYHDVHRHFPPASVMGPDGKTPHSWRVELLPFLEQQKLYDQYRMNEPWDSAHNKVILRNMPDVFRSPFDPAEATNSAYYVLVGPGTVFEGPDGIKIREIIDGTSSTLLVVEAKRNIPWTKPEDITFDPAKPLPELGGYTEGDFFVVFADGAAHRLQTNRVKDQLKLLIQRNDAHVINYEALYGR